MAYQVFYTRPALKDAKKLSQAGLQQKAEKLIAVIAGNPFQYPPPYEKLSGSLTGLYSRRINVQHRLVYQVFKDQHAIKVLRMWTHYE